MKFRITALAENTVFQRYLRAEHGLSLLVEVFKHDENTENSAGTESLIFDTGASPIFDENAHKMGISLKGASMIVLSHRHWDHTGGLLRALKYTRKVLAHPKVAEFVGDEIHGIPFSAGELEEAGVEWNFLSNFVQIADGVYFTGEVPRKLMPQFGDFPDDASLVLDLGDTLGLVCGCCHAGVVNVAGYVEGIFKKKLSCITGGLHLFRLSDAEIEETGERLKKYLSDDFTIHLSHCSGTRALSIWTRIFGGKVRWLSTGMSLIL